MEAKLLQDIFIEILRCKLSKTELEASVKELLSQDVIYELFSLADKQDLSHIIASYFLKNKISGDIKLGEKLKRAELTAIYRQQQMQYTYSQICNIFDNNSIAYIPLKGAVLRKYYPEQIMRTSCDIDILVKEEQLDKAIVALIDKGYKSGKKGFHDVSLYSPNNVHLELHFSICEDKESLDVVLKDAWQYAEPVDKSKYKFKEEFFAFYMFAHLSYHFFSGGCGIRPLMDIWVMKNKMGVVYQNCEELLKQAGIYKFALEIDNLVDCCFSGKKRDDFYKTLISYIFKGGLYGTSETTMAVKKEKTKSTFSYTLKRLFMPYNDMKVLFPVLKKIPILLPFCWIIRIFKMLIGGKVKASISEVKMHNSISSEEIEEVKHINERMGL